MKKPLAIVVALFSFIAMQAQLNMSLQSTWDGNNISTSGVFYNDIWGYVDDQGNEYAVLGSPTKVHFLDVTNPTNPVLKGEFTGGSTSIWRDMKSYDRYVYAVADQGSEGLIVFDMSALPAGNITKVYQQNNVFSRSHNIYIDAPNARLYVVGSNTQNGGFIIYSLADPANPAVIANVGLPGGYIHDIFVQNNIAYCSHGYNGLYVYDCTNPASPVQKANINTGAYNHSSWITEDGGHLIYAEEVPEGRPLGIIDLAGVNQNDLSISSTFSYPLEAPSATNVTYHNPYIVDNYAIVSSYLDGVTIIDISNPASPQRVAWYDTDASNSSYPGLDGCWGVYPFFPSGNIIASDIANGLFVLSTSIPLTSECGNGSQDAFESGVDCGGFCVPCAAAPPTCDDGIQNGNETGIDCGGPDCAPCPPAPTCDDGIQNGDEEGIDCGGSNCAPCPCNGTTLTVTIVLDNYPEETSWSIVNAGGSTVASGGTYGSQPDGSTVTFSDCFTDGCYDFIINDVYGDGICCGYGNGSYAVTDDASNVLVSGGSFASSETTNFCLTSTPACTPGNSCDDGDVCTTGDAYDANCNCVGIFQDADGDGTCDANDLCDGPEPGTACDDENPITTGDVIQSDCSCAGTPLCTVNASCDDGDACTTGDTYDSSCNCVGIFQDSDSDGVCDAEDLCNGPNPGATCDDDNPGTENDVIQPDCSCAGTLIGGCTYAGINNHDFESGWGIWNDGGTDVRRSANDATYANSGSYCVRLRDNSGAASAMTTDPVNLSAYNEITINFSYYARSMETNENFFLEIDNGSGFTTIGNYIRGLDFNNNGFYSETEVVPGPFSATTTLRIRCDASGNNDQIYIDDVNISGCANSLLPLTNSNTVDNVQNNTVVQVPATELTLYPNPVRDQLTIAMTTLELDAQFVVIDFTGKVIHTQALATGTQEAILSTTELSSGYYFLSLIDGDGKRTTRKFVVVK